MTDQWSKSEVVKEAAEAIVDKSLSRDNPFVVLLLLLRGAGLTQCGAQMSMMFWMGPRHTITGLHADTEAMNVLHQMHGSKVHEC